ncbi:hypothetical protein AB0N05_19720 [Nocardia sp. NPDC051030]|uniref:hypothetical protein n=1 Tax=Nocardia sp. NPDC051030 TaxID=3155162 RepID=UPI003444118B
MVKKLLVAGLLAASSVAFVPGTPATAAEPSCTAPVTTEISFGVPLLDWSENLGYDAAGNLWVSRTYRNEVQRYDSAGHMTATVPVQFPGAVRLGPDGLMYANSGDSPSSLLTGSSIVRFDPNAAEPRPEVFAAGRNMVNGAAFDAEGFLYVTDSLSGVLRIRPDGSTDDQWASRAKIFGANGLAVIGRDLYVGVLPSLGGQILRVPIGNPEARVVAAQLNAGILPAFPDDLTVGPDGQIYVATALGRLARVDPNTGGSCTVYSGEPMTSVAVDPGGDLTVGTESGDVLRVHLR